MRLAWLAIPVALLLLPAAAGEATLLREIADEHLANTVPLGEWHGKPPSLADVDRDGDLELVAQNGNGRVYVIDPRSGTMLVEVAPRYPYGPDLGPFNGPKAADLDGDGVVELVNVNRAAVLSVWHLHVKGGAIEPALAWDRHLNDHHGKPSADAPPALGDLDGDGKLEIVAHTEENGLYAFRHDGSKMWSIANWGGNAEARIVDIDGDGDQDVVAFTDAGVAYAVDGDSAQTLWSFDAAQHGAWPASITYPGAIADIDADGRLEVVFCARNIEGGTPDHAPEPYSQHNFVLFAIRDGKLLWKAHPDWGSPLCGAYLMTADADGDGKREIYGMDWNTIGHKPGDWTRMPRAHAFAFRHDGSEIWHTYQPLPDAKANIAMSDWTGDGTIDVIAYANNRLDILDVRTGAVIESVGLGDDVIQGPLVADLDGDGDADAVVAVAGAKLRVYDTHAPLTEGGWPGWSPVR